MIRKDNSIMKKTLKAFTVNEWNTLAGKNASAFGEIEFQVWISINAKNVGTLGEHLAVIIIV